ncbi:MAG: hypothetical protein JKX84_06585 [Flavobacteriales bacterium]|nr:hypothetical protein [Flavobacteriales bacterium]
MKFIKTILGVLLLLIAVLLLIGVFIPEVDDKFETRIERPVVGVFASMLNTKDLPNWIKGLDEIKQTSGFLAMPGSTFDLYYQGKETESVYKVEILEMIPLQLVRFKMQNEMIELDVSLKIEADDLATIVTVYYQGKGKGIVARSFLPLLKSVLTDELRENLSTFKQLQEQP